MVKPRMIKSFSRIILRTVKRNDIVRGILRHYNEELQESLLIKSQAQIDNLYECFNALIKDRHYQAVKRIIFWL